MTKWTVFVYKRKTVIFWMVGWALFFGAFWYFWNIRTGRVPVRLVLVIGDKFFGNPAGVIWQLSFAIPRYWDMVVGPVFPLIFAWLYGRTNEKERGGLIFGLGFGLIVGLASDLFSDLASGLAISLLFALFLASSLVFDLMLSTLDPVSGLVLALGLGFGSAYGLAIGCNWSMPIGLVAAVIITSPLLIVLGVWRLFRAVGQAVKRA